MGRDSIRHCRSLGLGVNLRSHRNRVILKADHAYGEVQGLSSSQRGSECRQVRVMQAQATANRVCVTKAWVGLDTGIRVTALGRVSSANAVATRRSPSAEQT